MFKKFLIFIVPILFLSACATKQDTFAQVNQISKNSQCSSCESPGGYLMAIPLLVYKSCLALTYNYNLQPSLLKMEVNLVLCHY